jgi:MHS family alpha-ketoglutarate permease-like MFS transporter
LIIFAVGGMLMTVPVMTFLGHTANPWIAFVLMTGALTIVTCYSALSSIVKAKMFPTKVRALGIGMPHALVTATFGGLTETIALTLKQVGYESAFFWYVTGCIAVTFLTSLVVREPSRNSHLDHVQEARTSSELAKAPPAT